MRAVCTFLVIPLLASSIGFAKTKPKSPAPDETSAAAATAVAEGAELIAEQVKPSLVKITQIGANGVEGLGSGFVISKDGLIATNMHVVGQGRRLQVETSDGRKLKVTAVHASDYHMDLAVLRVDANDLKPLALGDSDKIKQGQPMVAMGHPQGLAFSVTQGVISAVREIEGRPMIQVATPIERGNSGGPLMDRTGRVLGVLTLKSVRTENLGFAEPVNDLKKLLEKPNTVPIERWLTIGVPDAHSWKIAMGARWTQHSGAMKCELPGEGFGGRTHCVNQSEVPEVPYDVVVNVKLDEESGAAGLIFCCDESNRCFGFYPTGGQLRLTRFDGPDVFSWTIFDTVESSAYRAGDWNQLRVHIEAERITCFVNGTEVINQEDSSFRDGHAGLCKFRSPGAEFKGFRVGADLRDKPVEPELATRVTKTLDEFLAKPQNRGETLDKLLTERGAGRRLLSDKVRELDAEVAALKKKTSALRKLSTDLAQRAVANDLKKLMAKDEDDIDLLQAALLIAKHDNPEVDVAAYPRLMDRMADELREDADIKQGGEVGVKRLNRYMFEENGFHVSRFDYENMANSYLSDVLENREGLPITLSIVFIELAKRLDMKDVCGMPMPGRFMVGYKAKPEDTSWKFNDVFDGGRLLTATQASKAAVGDETDFDAKDLQPATKQQIIVRMLNNLISSAQGDSQIPTRECIPYLGLLIAVEPDEMRYRFSRAVARNDCSDWNGARDDLSAILENPPPAFNDEQMRELHAMYEALGRRVEQAKEK